MPLVSQHRVPEPSPGLRAAVWKENSAVVVLGSGLSCAAGGPTWFDLLIGVARDAYAHFVGKANLRELATAVDLIKSNQFLDGALVLKGLMNQGEFSDSVIRQLDEAFEVEIDEIELAKALAGKEGKVLSYVGSPSPRRMLPLAAHSLLVQIPFRAYITTNYDTLLEEASLMSEEKIFSYFPSTRELYDAARDARRFIIRVHGDRNSKNDLVIARDDYARLTQNSSSSRQAVHDLLKGCRTLWIGYGHNDPDLDLLVDYNNTQLCIPSGQALVRDDIRLKARLKQANITAIPLDSHDDVVDFLCELANDNVIQVRFPLELDSPVGDRQETKLAQRIAQVLQQGGLSDVTVAKARVASLDFVTSSRLFAAFRRSILNQKEPIVGTLRELGVGKVDGIVLKDLETLAVEKHEDEIMTAFCEEIEKRLTTDTKSGFLGLRQYLSENKAEISNTIQEFAQERGIDVADEARFSDLFGRCFRDIIEGEPPSQSEDLNARSLAAQNLVGRALAKAFDELRKGPESASPY